MTPLATYTLPNPPGVNHMFIVAKNGTRFLNPDYRKFKLDVASLFKKNFLEGELEVHLAWYRPRRVGDIDGRIKATLDSLEGIAYENDKTICKLVIERFEDKKNPRMEVSIFQYGASSSCKKTGTTDTFW